MAPAALVAPQEYQPCPNRIIDAHHHIWRLAETAWLNGPPVKRIFGDYQPIRKDYLAKDFMADVVPTGVVKSVYMQVNVAARPGDRRGQMGAVARPTSTASRMRCRPLPTCSIPASARCSTSSMACSNTRAIRQQIHWHENPQYRFADRPDVMNDPQWRRGLKELGKRKLMFELQVFSQQMDNALKLVRDFPEVTFVLQHCGMLQDTSPEGVALLAPGHEEPCRPART